LRSELKVRKEVKISRGSILEECKKKKKKKKKRDDAEIGRGRNWEGQKGLGEESWKRKKGQKDYPFGDTLFDKVRKWYLRKGGELKENVGGDKKLSRVDREIKINREQERGGRLWGKIYRAKERGNFIDRGL